jgi:16S rRNA (guanine527-N7)-methyltransferase
MPDRVTLLAVLESLRDRGALGESSLPRAIAHAEAFVAPLSAQTARLIDLGSGGGLPGLVLADRLPGSEVVLTERRERRADLLRLAVSRLGWEHRVTVFAGDVVALGRDPAMAGSFDAVTARAFGEPLWTLQCASVFLNETGVAVISEPPASVTGQRWPADAVSALGLEPGVPDDFPFVRCFRRRPRT